MRRVIGWAALAALVACTNGDCTQPSAEANPEHFARWLSSELDRPADLRDLTVGSGRLAQYDRRMVLEATISSTDGAVLASGPLRVEWPVWEARGEAVVRRRSRMEDRLFGGIGGMRVGGERQFSLHFAPDHPDDCQPLRGHCTYAFGPKLVEIPPGNDLVFRVKLLSVCAPRYCEQTTYSIPKSEAHALVERWCR